MKVSLIAMLLFYLINHLTVAQVNDSTAVSMPDSIQVSSVIRPEDIAKKKEKKQKTVAVLVITAVSATIFLLYNVRSQ